MSVMLQLKLNNKKKFLALSQSQKFDQRGFTLIEMMIVVILIAIIAAIAFPSYKEYVRKASESAAQQEVQKIAEQLERFRSKNFTYRKFDPNYIYSNNANPPALTEVVVPIGATGTKIQYKITIRDLNDTSKLLTDTNAKGRGWSIRAETDDNQKNTLLMTSEGLRCQAKGKGNVTYTACTGSDAGVW